MFFVLGNESFFVLEDDLLSMFLMTFLDDVISV